MKRPSIPSLIPVSAHSADNKIIDVVSKHMFSMSPSILAFNFI